MRAMGLEDRMHFVAEYLQPALDLGLIELTLPDKPRSSQQRYRLSPAGRNWNPAPSRPRRPQQLSGDLSECEPTWYLSETASPSPSRT